MAETGEEKIDRLTKRIDKAIALLERQNETLPKEELPENVQLDAVEHHLMHCTAPDCQIQKRINTMAKLPKPETKPCAECGAKEIPQNAKYCPECGEATEEEDW